MHQDAEPAGRDTSASPPTLFNATYQLKAGPSGAVRHVLVTLNAATDVTAGSRFEAKSPEAIASIVNGLSVDSEVLRLQSSVPIVRVHAAQAGSSGYLLATSANVAENRLALWTFSATDAVHQVEIVIGPSPDGGATLPITCVPAAIASRGRTS